MTSLRRVFHIAAWLMGGLALAVSVVVAALPLWLRTGHGHRTVERVLTHLLNERVPGTVSVGRLSGAVVGGLRAQEVTVRNPRGELVGRADWMSARWRPFALLRRHELEVVTAAHPVLMLDRATWRVPPEQPGSGPSKATTIRQIIAQDGQVSWKSTTLHHVSGTATLDTNAELDVHAVSATDPRFTLHATGKVDWASGPTFVATRFTIERPDSLHGTGELFYTPGRLEGRLDELTIEAPVATKLVGGNGPVRLRGRLLGAPDNLSAAADAAQGGRALRLRAFVNGAQRSARIDARLTGVPRPIRLHARGSYRDGALRVPTLQAALGGSRLRASGELREGAVRASISALLAPSEASLLSFRPAAPIRAHLDLDGPLRRLRVDARASLQDARLRVRARCDLVARGGHAELVAREVRPAQLIAGAPSIAVSGAVTLDGRWAQNALLASARLSQGRLTAGGHLFDRLAGAADVRLAPEGHANVHRLSGRFVGRHRQPQISTRGLVRWTGKRIALVGVTAAVDGSSWTGDASYVRASAPGGARVSARVDKMTLTPDLVAYLVRPLGYRPGTPLSGRALLEGTRDDFTLHLEATTELGPASIAGRLRRADDRLELTSLDLRVGDSFARGAAQLQRGRLTASLDELLLQPALVHRLVPQLEPAWPVRVHGTAAGPLDALELALDLDAGPSTAKLRGRLAARERHFQLAGQLDTIDVALFLKTQKRVRGTFQLAAEGRFAKGGVVGTLTARNMRGYMLESPFYRGLVDARFDGLSFEITRARTDIPGARIVGHGHGAYGKGLHIGYGVVVTNAFALRRVPHALRTLLGITTFLPGRTVAGAIEKRPGGKVRLEYHVLPIGLSQLELLYRVLTGRPPTRDEL